MIDTIKLGIPLKPSQYKRIKKRVAKDDRYQWVLYNEAKGEMHFRKVSGDAPMDKQSYHRQLRWNVPPSYEPDCCLTIEFSVPKLWYGHNIDLLYGYMPALEYLKGVLETQFSFKRLKLTEVKNWIIFRLDVCYAWLFPSQALAHRYLNSLKRLNFPRKSPVIYPTAIVFVGKTYSIKFYEKSPEFRSHDRKELLKGKASLEWVNHLEEKAEGNLRCEATLRTKFLRRHGIKTIGDLNSPVIRADWHDKTEHPHMPRCSVWSYILDLEEEGIEVIDGGVYTLPPVQIGYYELDDSLAAYPHPGGNFTLIKRHQTVLILQYLLEKFIGANSGMQRVDEVEAKLMEAYKPVKAARLVGMWLYVQKFGTTKTRDIYGHNSYYVAKREMKAAGVSLIEPPIDVRSVDRRFLEKFRLELPSDYVSNKHDNFRESENVLNYVPKMSEQG